MKGELFINDKDAYTTWGISIDDGSLSELMTPSPMKEYIENSSRSTHGKDVITSNCVLDERNLTLRIHLTAKDKDTFFSNYLSFCDELFKGVINIRTKYQPNIVYRTVYLSCSQFSEFMKGMAFFSLMLCEPNPKNRGLQ